MVMFLNNDFKCWAEKNYVLSPYTERCSLHDLATLTRRRINLITMFLHGIISNKFKSTFLRSRLKLNNGERTVRRPELIRVPFCRTEHTLFSSFNKACHIYNQAALFIDVTSSITQFRRKLLTLPDKAFGIWADM